MTLAPAPAPRNQSSTTLHSNFFCRLNSHLTTLNSNLLPNEQRHYPYGESLQAEGTANASVLRKFTTYLKEEETDSSGGKLNYAVFRSHSARTGRFLMADPLQGRNNPQGLNRYVYATNNPANRIDPRGLADTIPSWPGWGTEELDQRLDPSSPLCGNVAFWSNIQPLGGSPVSEPSSFERWSGLVNALIAYFGSFLPDWFPAFQGGPAPIPDDEFDNSCGLINFSTQIESEPLDCSGGRNAVELSLRSVWTGNVKRRSIYFNDVTITFRTQPASQGIAHFSDPRWAFERFTFKFTPRLPSGSSIQLTSSFSVRCSDGPVIRSLSRTYEKRFRCR